MKFDDLNTWQKYLMLLGMEVQKLPNGHLAPSSVEEFFKEKA